MGMGLALGFFFFPPGAGREKGGRDLEEALEKKKKKVWFAF